MGAATEALLSMARLKATANSSSATVGVMSVSLPPNTFMVRAAITGPMARFITDSGKTISAVAAASIPSQTDRAMLASSKPTILMARAYFMTLEARSNKRAAGPITGLLNPCDSRRAITHLNSKKKVPQSTDALGNPCESTALGRNRLLPLKTR